MLNTYKVVLYMQWSLHFCNIHTPDDGSSKSRKYKETN